ncbi:MAG: hypothetical protein RLZZ618_4212 [Pseudomonadota bacterium]
MCTFNGARYVQQQIDSLLQQDWPRIEVVVSDDGSTDGTQEILAACARNDPRIQVTFNPVNLGFQKNFEATIARCTGEWIAPCDQDDLWLPPKLSVLMAALQQSGGVMAYCDSELIDEHAQPLGVHVSSLRRRFNTDDPIPLLLNNNVSGHAMLFSRALLAQAMPFPSSGFHDWWLAYVAASTGHVCYVDRGLVLHRQHGGNVTNLRGAECTAPPRARGFRRIELDHIAERLANFARIPGKGQDLALELLALWQARETQWISGALFRFVWRHRTRLFAIDTDSNWKKFRKALTYLWGLRTKELLEPHRYVKSN